MVSESRAHAKRRPPELPADAWGAIARLALHAEADDVRAWARPSLVNSNWRAALRGVRSKECAAETAAGPVCAVEHHTRAASCLLAPCSMCLCVVMSALGLTQPIGKHLDEHTDDWSQV
jgi:hypothetical protein